MNGYICKQKNNKMDDLEQRVSDLESNKCCRIYFYSDTEPRPDSGKSKVLYIHETSGVMSIWNGSAFVDI